MKKRLGELKFNPNQTMGIVALIEIQGRAYNWSLTEA